MLLTIFFIGTSFATNGYLGTSYSNTIKGSKGDCVHSSSFNNGSDKLLECNK